MYTTLRTEKGPVFLMMSFGFFGRRGSFPPCAQDELDTLSKFSWGITHGKRIICMKNPGIGHRIAIAVPSFSKPAYAIMEITDVVSVSERWISYAD
jgi:hypothetical protein